ncbi:MAG: T9SS type A sorting domain-containing protein [Bacteroidales bacterium]|nr:T9SS type A sorting domain-containing protein [Bacteroidales bacterium]
MHKIKLLISLLAITTVGFSQIWRQNLPQYSEKNLSYFEYQDAFTEYWSAFNVKNGKLIDASGTESKIPGWNQFQRWAYYWETRVNSTTGEFPNFNLNEIYNHAKEKASQNKSISGNWQSLGPNSSPGGYAGLGRLNCIQFHPTDQNTFWVGAASGGIWVTTNAGTTWTVLNNNTQVLGINDIIIPSDYATSSTIYIATGDKDGWDNRSVGVLKSIDAGTTWNTTGLSFTVAQGQNTNRLLLDPNNNQTIIAATTSGVYKTTDGASNWTLLSSNSFIDLEYKPGEFTTMYGSTTSGEIYTSTDGGSNWTLIMSKDNRVELAVSPDEPTWVYALVSSNSNGLEGVYKSSNSGISFSQVFNGLTSGNNLMGWYADGSGTTGQGWYDLSLAVHPTDANTIYLGGINTWRSTNGGISWSMVNHWWGDGVQAVHADKHSLHFNQSTNTLFECNDGGVYSTTNGTDWSFISNTLEISQIYRLGTSKTNSTETIVGLQDNGTKLLSNGTWDDVKGGDGMECIIDYTDVNVQYGTYVYGEIERTTNHWLSGTIISDNIPGGNNGAWVTPYIMDPVSSETLYVGYEDVWKTTDKGNSWTMIGDFSDGQLHSMAIAPSNANYIYTATYSKLQRTTNGGTSWSNITSNLPISSVSIKYISVKADDPNTIWIAMSGYSGNGVYESVNGGGTWTNIASGLPDIPTNTVIQNKINTTEIELYAGTDAGVYVKIGSANWQSFSSGLPNVVIDELEIYYDDATSSNSRLRAATYGRGLWETDLYDAVIPTPICTSTATPDCNTGTIRVSSNLSGSQTFYLTDNSGTVLNNATANAAYYDFTSIADGTYRGKVERQGMTSSLSDAVILTNYSTPDQPSSIDGESTVCEGSSQTYSVSNVDNVNYSWSIPSGWSGSSTSNSIIVSIGANGGTISVTPSNSCGNGNAQTLDVSVNNTPAQPSAISGEAAICSGTTQTYTVTNVSGVTYNWNIPTGWSGNSSTNSITVVAGTNSGTITVTPSNSCGNGSSQSLTIEVTNIPDQPSEISGETIVCEGNTLTYSVINVEGSTYSWTLPSGWSGSSTTNSITVVAGSSGGDITVTATNQCGTGASQSLSISLGTLPDQPSVISGLTNPCTESEQIYSVTNVDGVTYNWTLPSGWSGNSTSSSITVTIGITGGTIEVTPSNGCGSGESQSMVATVNQKPSGAGTILGPNEVNVGDQGITFSIDLVDGAETYDWILDNSWVLLSGGATNQILIDFPAEAVSGTLMVSGVNECGSGDQANKDIQVKPDQVISFEEAGIHLYPNPNSGRFNISIPENLSMQIMLEIFDTKGKRIYSREIKDEQQIEIDLSTQSNGIYIMKINTRENVYISRIMIKK